MNPFERQEYSLLQEAFERRTIMDLELGRELAAVIQDMGANRVEAEAEAVHYLIAYGAGVRDRPIEVAERLERAAEIARRYADRQAVA